jgi:hydroxymethylpyrimidine pyrophosphatase-like HAD family hydrolase
VFCNALEEQSTRRLLAFAETHGAVAQYYHGATGEVYARSQQTEAQRELTGRYAALVGHSQIEVHDGFEQCIASFPSAKMLLLTHDPAALLVAAEQHLPSDAYNYFPGSPHPYFVEFLHPTVSKGSGLEALCKALGVAVSQVVAFGDGENDKEFLSVAGKGVAMSNARPLAKQAADMVIELSNDEEGVAQTLRTFLEQGLFSV